METKTDSIVECYHCGLFIEKIEKKKNQKLKCPRCYSAVHFENDHSLDSLYYAISAILVFILLNLYPFVSLSVGEKQLDSTLLNTVLILFEQDFFFVGILVLLTIIIAPLLNSFIVILFFIQEKFKIKLLKSTLFYDSFHFFKTWGFIEVFIVSIIVTYIKLIGMVASTRFDLGFYIILIYAFLFYMSNKKFEIKSVFK